MKLNNKGFAISSILYIILIMCIILMTVALSVLGSRKLILDKQKSDVLSSLYNEVKELKPYSPELINGLIPVVYENSEWKVVNRDDIWYDYENQEWANAVILKGGVTKKVGDTIDVSSEIQGMFVWIPRYEYKIDGVYGTHSDGTVGTQSLPGEIKINFILKSKTKATDGYIIHPAFTFGDEELSGIWVGKFETTGTADNPTVLPSVVSLRIQTISKYFATVQKFNTFLLDGDSHIAKNSEWGAVAYLSQSIYGKYGNPNYIGVNKEVMINNCNSRITGVGADSQNDSASSTTCTTNTYETEKGQAASTTGNITGIYDMNGGSWEFVMGVNNNTIANSGFETLPNPKYYDNYTTINATTACNSGICYGHALSETSNWYEDFAIFTTTNNPWFIRGGYLGNNNNAGVFSSSLDNGNTDNRSARVVIAPVA